MSHQCLVNGIDGDQAFLRSKWHLRAVLPLLLNLYPSDLQFINLSELSIQAC
jgi:hypothetical protein